MLPSAAEQRLSDSCRHEASGGKLLAVWSEWWEAAGCVEQKKERTWLFPEIVPEMGFLRHFILLFGAYDIATLKLMPRWALHDRTHACSVRLRYTWLRRPILLGGARRTATVESTPLLSITALTLGFITVYITCTTVASRVAANACDTHLRFLTEPLLLPCHARVTRNPYAVTSLRRYGLIAF